MNKYTIKYTNKFKKAYKNIISKYQNKENEFIEVVKMLANDVVLPEKYHNHLLEPKSNRIMGMSY